MVVTINANIKKQAIIIFGFTRYSNCETIWSTGVSGRKIYSEIGMFLMDYLISGTIDILLVRDDKFIIGDWNENRKSF